jgi:tRNA threonylcarbamoyladenosine biosynthesis protein TsaB
MSLILHIETASTVCSVALAYEGKLLSLKEENKGYTHAEHLTLFIEEVMHMAGKKMSDLAAVSVSKGPGSYTGLRIGVATAKGLCYGLGKPLIAINTLNAMAKGASQKHQSIDLFCPMLDARRMEVYTSLINKRGDVIEETQALILSEGAFEERLNENEILFFGDGSQKFNEIIINVNAKFDFEIMPSALYMIELAYTSYQSKTFENLAYFEPFYLKEFYSPAAKTNSFFSS